MFRSLAKNLDKKFVLKKFCNITLSLICTKEVKNNRTLKKFTFFFLSMGFQQM